MICAELVAVAARAVEDRQHQELGAALLQRAGREVHRRHIGMKHIYMLQGCQRGFAVEIGPRHRRPAALAALAAR